MDNEIERPQECYNFRRIRDFLKTRLHRNKRRNRGDRDHNRSPSIVTPFNVKDKASLHNNIKANNEESKDTNYDKNGVNRIEEDAEELLKKIQKNGNYGNNIFHNNNNKIKESQRWEKPPENSRAPSMNRTYSAGTWTTASTTRENSFRSTRSNSNKYNEVTMSSFRSFNKSKSGCVIMFSNSSGVLKPPAMEMELECSLEELCFGCAKKITVSRNVYSSIGHITQEEELLAVNVKPGWKSGTKITFAGTTSNGEYKADVIFIVSEKPHHLFLRNNDDLEMAIEIPLVDALAGCTLTIPLLGGENMSIDIQDDVVYPGFQKLIRGRGLPNQNNTIQRGDLKVKFRVDFPKSLTEEQRVDILDIFSGVDI